MKVTLVSHASVLIESQDLCIWTDPWLHGTAFNDSWSLIAPAAFDAAALDRIDAIWISHEHPDHFHIPTLKSLPDSFKQRVTILFQQNNSDKMFAAFERLGFPQHRALPNREIVDLGAATSVYCYQVGQMDSSLAVMSGGCCVLDINDAEMNARDCRLVSRDIGSVDTVLNQFSIAGYGGFEDRERHLSTLASRILANVSDNHRDLGARVTIPIASFVYFSAEDNRYVNEFANTPQGVVDHLAARDQETVVLFPSDSYEVGSPHDSQAALERWDEIYGHLDRLAYDPIESIPLDHIERAFHERAADLAEKYPRWMLRLLGSMRVRIPDLDRSVVFSISQDRFEPDEGEVDLEINSQPLQFAFDQPFGLQTLGVSARLSVLRNYRRWRLHRILFSLNNAELHLQPRYLFTRRNLQYIRSRFRGGVNQLTYQLARMR